jgi:heme-degrading monooxygenase HmoA
MSAGPAIVRIWRYRVDAPQCAQFERIYGGNGDWARLFAQGEGYLGTRLLRDPFEHGVYITVDRWRSADDWRAFLARFASDYAALDRACDALTREELDLGQYEDIG